MLGRFLPLFIFTENCFFLFLGSDWSPLGVGVVQTQQVDKVFFPWGRQGAKTSDIAIFSNTYTNTNTYKNTVTKTYTNTDTNQKVPKSNKASMREEVASDNEIFTKGQRILAFWKLQQI